MKTKPVNGAALALNMLARKISAENLRGATDFAHRSAITTRLNSSEETFDFGLDEDAAAAFTYVPTMGSVVIGARELGFDTRDSLRASSAWWTLQHALKNPVLTASDRWAVGSALINAATAAAFTFDKKTKKVAYLDPDALQASRAAFRELRGLLGNMPSSMFQVDRDLVKLLLETNLAGCVFLEESAERIPLIGGQAEQRYEAVIARVHDLFPAIKQKSDLSVDDPSRQTLPGDPLVLARLILATALQGLAELWAAEGRGDEVPAMLCSKGGIVFSTPSELNLLLILCWRAAWPHTRSTFGKLLNGKRGKEMVPEPQFG